MTAMIMQATPFVETVGTTLRAVYVPLLRALDALVEAKVRNAVPEWQLREARREIARYRRLMHADQKSPVNAAQTGR